MYFVHLLSFHIYSFKNQRYIYCVDHSSVSFAMNKISRNIFITVIIRNASLKLPNGCCFRENFTYQKKQLFYKKTYIHTSLIFILILNSKENNVIVRISIKKRHHYAHMYLDCKSLSFFLFCLVWKQYTCSKETFIPVQ